MSMSLLAPKLQAPTSLHARSVDPPLGVHPRCVQTGGPSSIALHLTDHTLTDWPLTSLHCTSQCHGDDTMNLLKRHSSAPWRMTWHDTAANRHPRATVTAGHGDRYQHRPSCPQSAATLAAWQLQAACRCLL